MKERTLGFLFFGLAAACGISFLAFRDALPLAGAIALKLAPTLLMCAWMLAKGVDSVDIFILLGLVFSLVCDFFMELPDGERFTRVGMGSNMLALVLYTVYFVRSDPGLDLRRLFPPALLMAVFFLILNPNLGENRLPVLAYCVIYALFLWRASARIGDEEIGRAAQLTSYAGSMVLAASDCVLGLMVFGLVSGHPALYASVMFLWWTGLFLLMATADIKTVARRARPPAAA